MWGCMSVHNTWEVEAGESRIQGHPWLHPQFEAGLDYSKLCFKTNKQKEPCNVEKA